MIRPAPEVPSAIQALTEAREALRGFETTALAGVAQTLSGVAESLSETAERIESSRPAMWMDSEQAAAYLGKTRHAFNKILAETDLPRHYLTPRSPLFNRREIDEWLMGR